MSLPSKEWCEAGLMKPLRKLHLPLPGVGSFAPDDAMLTLDYEARNHMATSRVPDDRYIACPSPPACRKVDCGTANAPQLIDCAPIAAT